jgi:hypothetical protein
VALATTTGCDGCACGCGSCSPRRTVLIAGWFCTMGPIPAILSLMVAKHVLVAILVMGLGVDGQLDTVCTLAILPPLLCDAARRACRKERLMQLLAPRTS